MFTKKITIYPPAGTSLENTIQQIAAKKAQHEIEFAFDIHKVLIHKLLATQIRTIWNYPNKWLLVRSLFNIPLMIRIFGMIFQVLLNHLPIRRWYQELTAEQWVTTMRTYGNDELANLSTNIINTQAVNTGMKQLIRDLHNHGYKLRIASNIGIKIYIKLKQHLEQSGENIFDFFEHESNGTDGKVLDYRSSHVQKPDEQYFREYQDTYNPDGKKLLIFVDDKLINIFSATTQGFVAIQFLNARRLRKDLVQLGLL